MHRSAFYRVLPMANDLFAHQPRSPLAQRRWRRSQRRYRCFRHLDYRSLGSDRYPLRLQVVNVFGYNTLLQHTWLKRHDISAI